MVGLKFELQAQTSPKSFQAQTLEANLKLGEHLNFENLESELEV